jgi:hypothetical protein
MQILLHSILKQVYRSRKIIMLKNNIFPVNFTEKMLY